MANDPLDRDRSGTQGESTRHLEEEAPLQRADEGPRKRHGDALEDGSGTRHGPPPESGDGANRGMGPATGHDTDR